MKKICFILVAAAMFIAVDAKAQLGVGVGYNLLNTTATLADESDDESLNGFYVEATYGFNFLNKKWGALGIEPGLRYTFGAEAEQEEILGIKTRASLTEHYLDIPVHVKYGYEAQRTRFRRPCVLSRSRLNYQGICRQHYRKDKQL